MDMKSRTNLYFRDSFPTTPDANNSNSMIYHYIPENSTVWDVGCANGALGSMLTTHKNCTVWGMDYNPYSIELAMSSGAYQNIYQADLNQLDPEIFSQHDSQFDFIIFADVLEHIFEPAEVLEKFKRFLKPDGRFLISLPNVSHISIKMGLLRDEFTYTPTGLLDYTHIRFFTHQTFPNLLSQIGLEIQDVIGTFKPPVWEEFDSFPLSCRRLLLKDIHSWVFQYILKLGKSANDVATLETHNREKMNFTKNSLPQDIFMYNDRSHYYIHVYCPFLRKLFFKEFREK